MQRASETKFTLRVPRTVHDRLVEIRDAAIPYQSINSLIVGAIVREYGLAPDLAGLAEREQGGAA